MCPENFPPVPARLLIQFHMGSTDAQNTPEKSANQIGRNRIYFQFPDEVSGRKDGIVTARKYL